MAGVMTVTGPVEPVDLGFTSMHEHCLCDCSAFRDRYKAFLPEVPPVGPDDPICLGNLGHLRHAFILTRDTLVMTDEEVLVEELSAFKAAGGSTVVEMSTPGIRSDVRGLCRASEKSGVHIIAPTGLYALDTWPERFVEMSAEEMEAFMLDEVENGIEGTDIRPGHIKVALETDFHPREVDAIMAAARVSQETGLLLTIHQGMLAGRDAGRRVIDLLKAENHDLSKVVLAHSDKYFAESSLHRLVLEPESWGLNIENAREVLDMGANISLDLFGHFWDAESLGIINVADWQSLAGLVALIRNGYSRQIVLGTDTFFKLQLRRYGGEGYCRLTDFVIPTLRKLGVSEDHIQDIAVRNPARLLSA